MITEGRRLLLALPVVLLAWIALLALVMRLWGQAPAALAILPPGGMLAALPEGTAIISAGPFSVTVSGGAGLVADLYAAGALLVLPAGLTGCLPQNRS